MKQLMTLLILRIHQLGCVTASENYFVLTDVMR